jgi:hypothetical protein
VCTRCIFIALAPTNYVSEDYGAFH